MQTEDANAGRTHGGRMPCVCRASLEMYVHGKWEVRSGLADRTYKQRRTESARVVC